MAEPPHSADWVSGDTEMARRIREFDWAATALGPLAKWPQSLRSFAGLMLDSREPAYIAWGPEQTSLYNDGYIPILGARHPAGLGKPYQELWPELWDEHRPIVAATMAGQAQRFVDLPVQLTGRAGEPSLRWFTFAWTPIRDETGAVAGFYCAATETTTRVIAEAAAHEANLQAIIDHVPAPICLIQGSDLRLRLANSAYKALTLGNDVTGKTLNEVWPETGKKFSELARRAMESGNPQHFEDSFTWSFDRVRLSGDDEWAILNVAQESTDSKRAEQALRASQERLQRVLETDAVGVVFFDYEGIVTDANEAFLRMTGYTRAEVERRELTWRRMTPVEWAADSEEAMRQLNATGRIGPYEKEYLTAGGSRRWMMLAGRDLGDGTISEYCIDITDRELAENDLRQSEARLAAELAGMRRLHRLQAALDGEQDLNTGFDEIVATACEFAGTDRGCAQLVSPDGERLEMVAYRGFGPSDHFIEYFRHEGSKAVCEAARRDRRRLIIEDVVNFPALEGTPDREVALAAGIRATQSTPMISRQGELVGVLSNHFPQPHRPGDGELRLLDLLAWNAANFVERHRADAALRESREKLASELEDAKQLQRVSSLMIEDEDGYGLCESILDASMAVMRADFGSLQLVDSDRSELRLVAWRNFHPDAARFWEKISVTAGTSCGAALRNGKRVIIPDVAGSPAGISAESRRHYALSGIAAMQSTPLVARDGQLVGMITTHWRNPHTPEERELRLLDVVTRQAADFFERRRAEEALRKSEEKYRTLFDSIDEGFNTIEVLFDEQNKPIDCRILEINPAYEKMTGLPRSVVGQCLREFMPTIEERVIERYGQVALTAEPVRFEEYVSALDRWFDCYASRVGGHGSNKVAVIFNDITARKRAEDALRGSEERFRLLALASSEIVFRMSADWSEMYALEGKCSLADTRSASLTWLQEYIPDSDKALLQEAIAKAISSRTILELEHGVIRADGTTGWAFTRAIPLLDKRREIVEWFGAVNDITERKRREGNHEFILDLDRRLGELGRPEDIEQTTVDALGMFLRVPRCYFLHIRENHCAVVEREYRDAQTKISAVGERHLDDFVTPEARERKANDALAINDVLADARCAGRADGWAALNIRAFVSAAVFHRGQWVASINVAASEPRAWREDELELLRDVAARAFPLIERTRTERALRESEARYRNLFETVPVGFGIIELIRDENNQVVDWLVIELNPALERHTGLARETTVGRRIKDVLPEADLRKSAAMYQDVVDNQRSRKSEAYRHAIGRWLSITASPIAGERINLVFEDITERKCRDEQLRESEARQAFLLQLSDALRPLAEAEQIKATATRLLGKHLAADRVLYVEYAQRDGQDYWLVENAYYRPGHAFPDGFHSVERFGQVSYDTLAGRTLIVNDVNDHPGISPEARATYRAMGTGAFVAPMLVKSGRFVACLCVQQATPRRWTAEEVALVEAVGERTWAAVQRARAEAALRASEEKYHTLFDTMDEGFTTIQVLFDDHGQPVDLRYLETNQAFERQSGLANCAGRTARDVLPNLEAFWVEKYAAVARTGKAERFEQYVVDTDRWLSVHLSRVGDQGSAVVAAVFDDITERKRGEANFFFLAELTEHLSQLTSIEATMNALGAKIGAYFALSLCVFAEMDAAEETCTVNHAWQRADVPDVTGSYRIGDFMQSEFQRASRAGEVTVVRDTFADPLTNGENFARLKIGSFVTVPLVRDGVWRFWLGFYRSEPANWHHDEIELMRELTNRIWTRLERARAEEALRDSEALVRSIIANLPGAAAFVVDHDLRYVTAGGEALAAAGFAGEGFVGRRMDEVLPPRLVAEHTPSYRKALAGEQFSREHTAHGHVYLSRGVPLRNEAGNVYAALAVSYDITERRRAEEALRESEQRFRLFVENVHEYGLFQTDRDGLITSWNPGAERLFGYTSAEMLGRDVSCLLPLEEQQSGVLQREIEQALNGELQRDARWLMRKDHSRFWAQWVTEPIRDEKSRIRGVATVLRDETERQRAEEMIRASLAEKEELLKEVHHRVKNNLQVITSLINLQARQVEDERVQAQLDQTRNRVYSIAAIHQLIYRSASFAEIDLAKYARQLVPDLLRFYGVDERIRVSIEGAGATLELERAVPFGLLLNELASNVCKHAFPRDATGELRVRVLKEDGHATLEIADTGVGLPAGFDYRHSGSLGLQLVHSLARQLRATIDIVAGPGTRVTVRIPEANAKEGGE